MIITKESANINSVCSSLNNITDIMCFWFSKLDKNQKTKSKLSRNQS